MSELTARRVLFGMRRSNFFTLALLGGLMCYLCFGALVFTYLEHNHEQELRRRYRNFRENFLELHHSNLSDPDLEDFLEQAILLHRNRIDPARNASGQLLWTFSNALLFCTTLVTTVGYGSIAALTTPGRAFSVIYAMLGIPLTLLLMGALVERLLQPCNFLMEYFGKRGRTSTLELKIVNLLLIGSLFFTFFLMLPSVIFSCLEPNWNLMDAMYYCFISLTTIGLGDLVPYGDTGLGFNDREWYIVSISMYLLSGFCFALLLLAVFYDVPQLNLGGYFMLSSDVTSIDEEATESVTIYISAVEKERLYESMYKTRARKFTM
ncbi:potassium channel subfamily K member 1 [Galendromus occidentalis]|uniref:Potassium channel subfamily K member 1 n=1 Tax=Galendromus occidentalis TaxID=34638 RepID=A0AAJ6QS14_9ACAR|nr:potassium channel subfamily K member 1 [Galendromus occidentalis]